MYCQKCGTQNEDVAKFCENCGAPLELEGSLNQQTEAETVSSENPATEVMQETVTEPAETPAEETVTKPAEETITPEIPADADLYPVTEPEKASDLKKIVKIAIAAAVAIFVVVLGFNLIKGILGGSTVSYEKHPVIYNKDGDIMVQLANKANPAKAYELGSDEDITDVSVTVDGKYIFYGDDYDGGEFDLFYRKTGDSKGNGAKKIKSGIDGYSISPNGKFVVFNKGSKAYFSNLKDEATIDRDINELEITGDSKYIIYTVEDDDGDELYIRKASLNAESLKVDSKVTGFYLPRNEETGDIEYNGVLYYTKEGDLYYVKNGKNPVKVLSDVGDAIYLGGKLYATTVEEKDVKYEDAYKETEDEDGYISKDLLPGLTYKTDDDGSLVYDENDNCVFVKREYRISTVDGKKAKALEGKFTDVYLYSQWAKNEDEYFVIRKDGKIISIGEVDEDADFCGVSSDEKSVYMIENIETDDGYFDVGTFNVYKLTEKGLGTKKEIANDVFSVYEMDNGGVEVFVKDGEETNLGVYYKNKYYKNIGKDIYTDNYSVFDNVIYFFEEYGNSEGSLMKYTVGEKEAEKIDEDVYVERLEVRGENMCYYIKDYDYSDGGDLFLVTGGGKPKLVDDEVSSILW